MPLNGKRLSLYSVGTMHYGRDVTGAHPAIYDPETHTVWYWPNLHFPPGEAGSWADQALRKAQWDDETGTQYSVEEFHENTARWNIYPVG